MLSKDYTVENLTNSLTEANLLFQINLLLIFIFLMTTLLFVIAILSVRISKNSKERRSTERKELYSDFINAFLFNEDPVSHEEIDRFRQTNIITAFDKKIAIKVLLVFEENLKGETSGEIKELFYKWKLDQLIEQDFKSGKWYKISRAIHIATALNLKEFEGHVENFLNAERDELRQQAIFYFIHLSEQAPLEFLDKIEKPLTLGEQIYIEEHLKNNQNVEIPNFSRWLNSKELTVVAFSIKMCGQFNQFENISLLIPYLNSKVEVLKKEAIKSLADLECQELLTHLKASFNRESPAVKILILKNLRKIGSFEDLKTLEKNIPPGDWASRQVHFKLKNAWKKELEPLLV